MQYPRNDYYDTYSQLELEKLEDAPHGALDAASVAKLFTNVVEFFPSASKWYVHPFSPSAALLLSRTHAQRTCSHQEEVTDKTSLRDVIDCIYVTLFSPPRQNHPRSLDICHQDEHQQGAIDNLSEACADALVPHPLFTALLHTNTISS
jgi:hypothetical protein